MPFEPFGTNAKDAIESLTINSYDKTGDVYRPTISGAGSYFGQVETERTLVLSDVPMEVVPLSPRDLVEEFVSNIGTCSDDYDVQFDDVIVYEGLSYRVTKVVRQDLFGTITHKELHLTVIKAA